MPAFFRGLSTAAVALSVLFFCSCDHHRLGEYPEVQREAPDTAAGAKGASTETAPAQNTPTPAEFFSPAKNP